jgi:hypothetical protein
MEYAWNVHEIFLSGWHRWVCATATRWWDGARQKVSAASLAASPASWPMTSPVHSTFPQRFPQCSLNVHSTFTQRSLNVHSMFTQCSLTVHSIFTQCSLNVHSMFPQCSLNVPSVFPQCSLNVHSMFPQCSLNVPSMFPQYRFLAQLQLIIILMEVLCGPRGNTWWTRDAPGIRRLVLLTLVLGTHVGKLYSASTLVLFLNASCSWDGGSRASAQLNLNVP